MEGGEEEEEGMVEERGRGCEGRRIWKETPERAARWGENEAWREGRKSKNNKLATLIKGYSF